MHSLKVASAPFVATAAEAASAALSDPALVAREYAATLANLNPMVKMLGLDAQDLLPVDRTAGGVNLSALDLNAALRRREGVPSVQTLESAVMRSAIANEAIHKLLQDRTQ
jgi:hypothetical protein